MQTLYSNHSCRIFEGFYESNLFNSDTEYHLNYSLNDEDNNKEYEIDFEPYCKDISTHAVELLADYCVLYADNKIIKSMRYAGLSSPQYYNFSTDKLQIKMDFNLSKLKSFIRTNKDDFNSYLQDNFTSYDGFWSFVSNNYNDFMADYNSDDKERCIDVMLEYYILTCIYNGFWSDIKTAPAYDTQYHYALYEYANEMQYVYAIEVDPE